MEMKTFNDMTYGMYLLGSKKDGKSVGCIVNSVVQVGKDPAVIAVSVNHGNYTCEAIKESGLAAVSILAQSCEMALIELFGFQSSRDVDKFEGREFLFTADDLPVPAEGIGGWLECRVRDTVELADATLFVMEVFEAERLDDRIQPMSYNYYQMALKGGVGKKAPGHVLGEDEVGAAGPRYVCSICGYIYDESEGPFEFLPADWKCPQCGAPKNLFELKV